MVVDTSAIVAILFSEADADIYAQAIAESSEPCIGAPTAVECGLVIQKRYGIAATTQLSSFLTASQIEVVPFEREHFEAAITALRRFGRGRHAAQLNLGDAFAYAVAKCRNQPLLFKGNDFLQTDIVSALP
jgi:ribonuclease VapC